MKRYIDAEPLKEVLKELESVIYSKQLVGQSMRQYDNGQLHAIKFIKELIDSLQQEQSCDTCTNDKGCVTCKDGELWEGKEQPSEDLEKEIQRYLREECSSDDEPSIGEIARHFANWQKEQMLKDAVEASVNYYENIPGGSYVELVADILNPTGVRYKDKVKIVIVKED